MPLVIASATPPQFDDVLSFWRHAAEVASSTDDRAGLTALFERDPHALLVATDSDSVSPTILGTLIAAFDGWRGGFYRLAVQPDRRGQGIGRALVAAGEERLRAQGVRRISLFAVEAHQGAVTFWNAVGYRPDPTDLRFVRDLV